MLEKLGAIFLTKPEKLHFKTSSGIKNIVGKDLITDRFVAIFELVKNAYDAKASKVLVSFDIDNGDHDQKFEFTQSIVIRDNGVGMNRDDLINKWLYLAYSDKKEGKLNNDRVFVGSKGIGRFSCDSLGEHLEIRTKKIGDTVEHKLVVNWSDFENNLETRFENIEVTYSSTELKPEEINNSYTVLKINTLRHEWNDKNIAKVTDSLRKLKNPFLIADGFSIYCGEELASRYKSFDKIPTSCIVQSDISEVLKDKCITIETTIDTKIKIALFDRGRHIYTLEKENESILKDTYAFISINFLTTSAKMTFARRMGVPVINYGNIFIYRNNFRVSPYGNFDYDLFGLNTRKTQGFNRYIGSRELIGHIDIKDDSGVFKETSSRNNGFMHNIYLDELQESYMKYAHRHLERYVNLISWGEDNDNNTEISLDTIAFDETKKFKQTLTNKANGEFELLYFDKDIAFEEVSPKAQLKKIAAKLPAKEQTQITEVIKKLDVLKQESIDTELKLAVKQRTIVALEQQNKNITSRRPESSYGEQLSHHFPAMADMLDSSIKELQRVQQSIVLPEDKNELFLGALRKIRRTALELLLFKNLLLNTTIDLRSPQLINWFDLAKQFAQNKNTATNNHLPKVICTSDSDEDMQKWTIHCNALEYAMMLENFYKNAIDHKGKYLQLLFKTNSIEISSDTPAINEEDLHKIFELGFSTKKNGTGIGLNQVYHFLKKCKLKISAQNISLKTRSEVCFQIER